MAPTIDILRETLAALSLETRGHKDVLKSRLARHKKAQLEAESSESDRSSKSTKPSLKKDEPATRPPGQLYDAFLCFDVEATCEQFEGQIGRQAFAWPNEIIEFPVVLLKWVRVSSDASSTSTQSTHLIGSSKSPQEPVSSTASSQNGTTTPASSELARKAEEQFAGGPATAIRWELRKIDEFQSYVRPKHRPQLSKFCKDLTEITQDQVDTAPFYPKVLKKFERDFISQHQLFTREVKTIWVTDGPWDLRDFVAKQVFLSNISRPHWLGGNVIDLRKLVTQYFASQSSGWKTETGALDSSLASQTPIKTTLTAPESLSIPSVLAALALSEFEGHLHSGIDDARNASRILIELYERGMVLEGNLVITPGREKRWPWMGKDGTVRWDKVLGVPGSTSDR